MISLSLGLRALVYLRRAARALESIAESQATLARAAADPLAPRPSPRKTVMSRMDPALVMEREKQRRRERGEAVDDAGVPA